MLQLVVMTRIFFSLWSPCLPTLIFLAILLLEDTESSVLEVSHILVLPSVPYYFLSSGGRLGLIRFRFDFLTRPLY